MVTQRDLACHLHPPLDPTRFGSPHTSAVGSHGVWLAGTGARGISNPNCEKPSVFATLKTLGSRRSWDSPSFGPGYPNPVGLHEIWLRVSGSRGTPRDLVAGTRISWDSTRFGCEIWFRATLPSPSLWILKSCNGEGRRGIRTHTHMLADAWGCGGLGGPFPAVRDGPLAARSPRSPHPSPA